MHSERLRIASGALAGLLAHHGCGFSPYYRHGGNPETPFGKELLQKAERERAENKALLAREALAYADALMEAAAADLAKDLGLPAPAGRRIAINSVREDVSQVE